MTSSTSEPKQDAQQILGGLPTASISDALDKLDLPGSLYGIGPLREGLRACGPAFTAVYDSLEGQEGTVGDFLDDVPSGSIIVIDNQGKTDCTVWGGIMTQVADERGIAATVINGVCRDTTTSLKTDYAIWSAGRFMRTGKDRVKLVATQENLQIDSVPIRPQDIVCCDEDGVVVVPFDRADEVATLAQEIENAENRIVVAVRNGATLKEARASNGYHSLQTTITF